MDHDMTQFVADTETVIPFKTPALYTAPVRLDTSNLPLLDVSTLPSNIFWNVLGTALTLRRDYESATECAFVSWLATMLPTTMIDAAGNLHVDTRSDPAHRSMFTAHTDTVHHGGGVNKVRTDGKFWRADKDAALGADDGSGIAILAHMINAGVPGYYVFFRGEERGGVGSSYLAGKMPDLFKDIDRAVAFDRAGYYDIITHQSGGRCCSDEFAEALGNALSTDVNWMVPCSGGVYTDTAEFTKLIPECTNVSVGYKNQHGDREEQDVEFLWELAQICIGVKWDELPTKRDPKVREAKSRYSYSGSHARPDDGFVGMDDEEWAEYLADRSAAIKAKAGLSPLALADADIMMHDDIIDDDGDDELVNEDTVLMAIEEFRTGEDKLWLRELIAFAAWPEEPSIALAHLPTRCITLTDLESAEDMLYSGWGFNQVLLELYNECAVG